MPNKVNNQLALEIKHNPRIDLDSGSIYPNGLFAAYPVTTTDVMLEGYTADAARKLISAAGYGVHIRQIDPDAVARLDQVNIKTIAFANPLYGTGHRNMWLRLAHPNATTITVIFDSKKFAS